MKAKRQSCRGFLRLGMNRRQALRAGVLGLTGLGLPGLLRGRAEAAAPGGESSRSTGFGRAKSCILIFQWGGPSQLDTWDPKPEAPSEIRGEFATIATRTPGLRISEHFPLLAGQSHRLAVVRSMTHGDPAHLSTAHRLLTGHLAPTPNSDAAPPSPGDWPHLGALVTKIRPTKGAVPTAVTMPWTVAHPAAPGGKAPGQHGGWLGKGFDPFKVEGDPNARGFQVGGLGLPEGVDASRLGGPSVSPRWAGRRHRLSGSWCPGLGRLPGPGPRRPRLRRGPGRVPDRRRGPQAPRPLRPEHPRPVPPAGPSTGRGRRRPGDGQLARRRPGTSGTPTATTSTASRTT